MLRHSVIIICLLWASGCRCSDRAAIEIAAAASTREPLERLAANFQARTGITIQVSLGPSSTLAKQIEEGGSAALFLSADEAWADYLAKGGLIAKRRDLLTNRLVVIVPADAKYKITRLADLTDNDFQRLALAGPGVPAGAYAREALVKTGIWEQVKDRVVSGKDVRATLAFVEQGEAEAGFVYKTDAEVSDRVRLALEVPEKLHRPIRYPLVLVKHQPIQPEAEQFYQYLGSTEATTVFRKVGFGTAQRIPGWLPPEAEEMGGRFLGLAAEDWHAVLLSLEVAGLAVLLSLPAGVGLAWLLARKNFFGKTLVETLVNLPLVMPPVVTGYLLLILLGKNGWIGSRLDQWFGIRIALTWWAAVFAVGVMGFPLLVRAVRLSFQGIDPRLYQAARSLGAGPIDAFFSVSLPLARNGVIAGAVLAFARALGEFGATLMFAGDQPQTRTLAIQLYDLHSMPGADYQERMWRLVLASLVLACAALGISEYLERRGQRRVSA
jgi:molybdate transport system permease protein